MSQRILGLSCTTGWRHRLPRALVFAAVSGLAFGVDMSVLAVLVHGLGWPGLVSRIVSIVSATSSSWFVNRHATFAARAGPGWGREWARYLAVNAIGMGLNYGIYALIVAGTVFGKTHPLWAVVPGGVLAMGLNYGLTRRWVFVAGRLSSHR